MIDKTRWTEEDIQNLIINQVKENINLDYKASASLAKMNDNCKKELSKDVSAFANSDGGILIYGVVEEGNIPIRIDDGCDPNVVTREWIEQIIDSRIQRKIAGIRIHQVGLSGENSGSVMYVISIPQSKDAPHMADDNRYYKRYNFKSAPMEDYEVRDVRKRNDHPNLKLDLLINPVEGSIEKELNVLIHNTSPVVAEYYGVRLYIDNRLQISKNEVYGYGTDEEIVYDKYNIFKARCLIQIFAMPKGNMPVWEGESFKLSTINFLTPTNKEEVYLLGWKVSGPGFMNSDFLKLKF
ncbi:ATP-binding protein [Paenibacillus amylolyticus]|uniref:AlbA family DNA-binding domain-containing protein n=1 Tax=Paenibacillus amylolyticus TaxID=1451 RepID=UPI00105A81B9|nr:ATP-binding protein [Paenibacillus amylolyticus]TDL70422.1 ATP-binding protein [Paenibacillus amylolyticus]